MSNTTRKAGIAATVALTTALSAGAADAAIITSTYDSLAPTSGQAAGWSVTDAGIQTTLLIGNSGTIANNFAGMTGPGGAGDQMVGATAFGTNLRLRFTVAPGTDSISVDYGRTGGNANANAFLNLFNSVGALIGSANQGSANTGVFATISASASNIAFGELFFTAAGTGYSAAASRLTINTQDSVGAQPVPEAMSLALLGVGLVGMGAVRGRRRREHVAPAGPRA